MRGTEGAVLLDTGILVALLDEADPVHGAAMDWVSNTPGRLHTVEPVLTEAAFFLPHRQRAAVADFVLVGKITVHPASAAGFRRIAAILNKYTDLQPDWADAMLVWVAEETGIHRIATLDIRDFSTYRIHGRAKFLIEPIR
jgi:predicted nucleic acid-binding protein